MIGQTTMIEGPKTEAGKERDERRNGNKTTKMTMTRSAFASNQSTYFLPFIPNHLSPHTYKTFSHKFHFQLLRHSSFWCCPCFFSFTFSSTAYACHHVCYEITTSAPPTHTHPTQPQNQPFVSFPLFSPALAPAWPPGPSGTRASCPRAPPAGSRPSTSCRTPAACCARVWFWCVLGCG